MNGSERAEAASRQNWPKSDRLVRTIETKTADAQILIRLHWKQSVEKVEAAEWVLHTHELVTITD